MDGKDTNLPTRSSTTLELTGKRIKMSSGSAQPVEAPSTAPEPQTAAAATSEPQTTALEQPQSSGNGGESTNVSSALLNEAGEVEAVSA